MRQSNDVNDAMNDVVMVVIHQQKRRVVLCYIRAEYIYIQFVLCYVWAMTGILGMPPACRTYALCLLIKSSRPYQDCARYV